MVKLSKPEKLTEAHQLSEFSSKNEILNNWLQRTALKNQKSGASTTYVVSDQETKNVVGYYSISAGSILRDDATNNISRNQPEPIPTMLLGRLAVDKKYEGKGVGRALFVEAYSMSQEVSLVMGIRALVVHAIDDEAKDFWLKIGFRQSPTHEMTLMLKIALSAQIT